MEPFAEEVVEKNPLAILAGVHHMLSAGAGLAALRHKRNDVAFVAGASGQRQP